MPGHFHGIGVRVESQDGIRNAQQLCGQSAISAPDLENLSCIGAEDAVEELRFYTFRVSKYGKILSGARRANLYRCNGVSK
jgi:hypothetical protein